MRFALALVLLFAAVTIPAPGQPRSVDFSGVWKLELAGAASQPANTLHLTMEGKTLTGTLNTPHGEFPIENGIAEGSDLFFNVVIQRDEYRLKTTYRGHLFSEEIQFTVEAGERTLQIIARRDD